MKILEQLDKDERLFVEMLALMHVNIREEEINKEIS